MTLAQTTRAALATVAAVPAITKAAWKAASWASGDSSFALVEGARTFGRAWAGGLAVVFSSWMGTDYTKLVKLTFGNPVGGRALRLIAQTMAAAPVYVEKRTPDGGYEQVDGFDDVLGLLDRPNARTTRESAALAIVTALYCGGEFWVDAVEAPLTGTNAGRPRAVRYIMPDEFVGFIRDETDEITGYRFRSRRSKTYTRTTAECHHVRLFHPTDEDRGLAVLVSAAAEMEGMANATAWNAALSKGGGSLGTVWRPASGVLESGGQLTKEQREAAQASLDELLRDKNETGRDRVISGALERVAGDATPRDADWSRAMGGYVRMIAAVMGVPATLIGDEKAGSLTDAGVDSEVAALYKLTVLPLLGFVLAEYAAFLLPPGHRFAIDTDQIEALGDDMDAKAERYVKLTEARVLTVNEGRLALGYDRMTEDGKPWTQPGRFDLLSAPAAPEPTTPFSGETDPALRSLGALDAGGFKALLDLVPQATA